MKNEIQVEWTFAKFYKEKVSYWLSETKPPSESYDYEWVISIKYSVIIHLGTVYTYGLHLQAVFVIFCLL